MIDLPLLVLPSLAGLSLTNKPRADLSGGAVNLVAAAGFEPATCDVMSVPSYRCSTLQC